MSKRFYDHYAVAKRVARHISEAGFPDWGRQILNAITASFTATEILMAIRWQLNGFKNTKPKISDSIKTEIDELIEKTNEALK